MAVKKTKKQAPVKAKKAVKVKAAKPAAAKPPPKIFVAPKPVIARPAAVRPPDKSDHKLPVLPEPPAKPRKTQFNAKELKEYKQLLLNLRDRIVDEINFLAGDNLNRSQRESSGDLSSYSFHMADQGTDNFDREFALNLVSSEQDALYEIDEALRRIDNGSYGICELSGEPIERERLKVLPYARHSVKAQSLMERGKTRFRPFGPTISHSVE